MGYSFPELLTHTHTSDFADLRYTEGHRSRGASPGWSPPSTMVIFWLCWSYEQLPVERIGANKYVHNNETLVLL